MRATDFEFRHRFWFIALIFWVSFSAYYLDPRNVGAALARLLAPGGNLNTVPGQQALHGVFWVAALLAGLSAWMRTWASAYLASERVHDPNLRTEGVVADGPYRHLRNPLYLGNLLLALAMGFAMSRLGMALVLIAHGVFLARLIGREEGELVATQGESYRAYLAAVPRLWPSLRPRVPAGGLAPRWGQAFAGETFFWLLFAGLAWFAVTLNGHAISVVAVVGMAFYLVMLAVLKRWRAR
jgi:protein-S-isoprenylcysteine O-methyltransferase Ste14